MSTLPLFNIPSTACEDWGYSESAVSPPSLQWVLHLQPFVSKISTISLYYIWIQSFSFSQHDAVAETLQHLWSHHVWLCTASPAVMEMWQVVSGKQPVGYRLQSKGEFLSRKNNETVCFYCILNEKSIDAPCAPVALHLQHNNRTAANSRLIWKKEGKQFTDLNVDYSFLSNH